MQKAKPVKVACVLMGPEGAEIEEIACQIINEHHPHLADANIKFAWAKSWSEDVDGILALGKAKKVSDPERQLCGIDFIIILNEERYLEMPEQERLALIDHELTHCAVCLDENDEPKIDELGRIVYRTRKHDFQEFTEIVARHKQHTPDIRAFATAIQMNLWDTAEKVIEAAGL